MAVLDILRFYKLDAVAAADDDDDGDDDLLYIFSFMTLNAPPPQYPRQQLPFNPD